MYESLKLYDLGFYVSFPALSPSLPSSLSPFFLPFLFSYPLVVCIYIGEAAYKAVLEK